MKKQPAKVNYFFKGCYVELFNTIKGTFVNLGHDIADAWHDLAEGFVMFWSNFFGALGTIISFSFEWDRIGNSIKGICKFSFSLGKIIFILMITTSICIFFSLTHIIMLLAVTMLAYICFILLRLFDTLYLGIKRISSNCPNCQSHFTLPVYICPNCGAEHTSLRPGKYGIWKRMCDCGHKLPTTFFNGRDKLESHCPACGMNIKDGGKHVDICIPIVGGASSGKTCFINQAISQIGENASKYNLTFEYSPNGMDDYEDNIASLNKGYLPEKTNEMRLKYYQFYLTPNNTELKNLVSLCDVGGEVYSDSTSLGAQIGYKYANAFLMVIDPLSIGEFRRELAKQEKPEAYGYSNESVDEIISMLVSTLENMFCISSKDMLKTDVAVVFSKCDITGLDAKIGKQAVRQYMQANNEKSEFVAQNAVCENFLKDYGEINFLNGLKSKFKTIQFFCASSLGHNANGEPFKPMGVEDPVLWLVDKISVSIDLKEKWGKKL